MHSHRMFMIIRVLAVAIASLSNLGCGIVAPSCTDETGTVLNTNGQVPAGDVRAFEVTSPKHSNLLMRLTWSDPAATLGLRATIINCGDHTGCRMDTETPPFGPGGSSPTPQPWPPGLREMLVDGTRGKTYRVEVTGDPERDAAFTVLVQYEISCER